jgi:colanic acid biosynthesis protein WcaM
MLKKITRRTFVSSYPFWRPRRCCRPVRGQPEEDGSVNQYNNNDWIAAFKQAFNDGDTVVVPAGLTCENINTGFSFPTVKRC